MNLKDKMLECIEDCKLKYPDLRNSYVQIIANSTTSMGVPIAEVFDDGFETKDGIFHPFIPFSFVDEELAKQIRAKELNNGSSHVAN